MLLEALVVGVLASVVGLVAGVGVAPGLKALLAVVGLRPARPAASCSPPGTVVVVARRRHRRHASSPPLSPARKAAKVPPVAAMRDVAVDSTGYGSKQRIDRRLRRRSPLGVAALAARAVRRRRQPARRRRLGALLVVLRRVGPRAGPSPCRSAASIGAPLPRLRGMTGSLARENAMRNPKRTAATAAALMIGVGLVGFITIFAASTKASIDAAVDRAFTGDFVLDSGGGLVGGVDPGLAERLDRIPEVAIAAGLRQGVAKVAGSPVLVQATDPRAAVELMTAGRSRDRRQAWGATRSASTRTSRPPRASGSATRCRWSSRTPASAPCGSR